LPLVKGINLGSLQKDNYKEIIQGGSAEFSILLWSRDESPFPVNFEIVSPPEFTVFVRPKELMISKYPLGEIEYLNLPTGLIKASVIKVFVKVSPDAKPGNYSIMLKVIAGFPENEISVLQERKFKFMVNVIESPLSFKFFDVAKKFGIDVGSKITGSISAVSQVSTHLFFYIVIILIILFSWVVYRYV
jgi:hypothetical protein